MAITVVILGFYGSQRRHVEKYALAWQANVPGVRRCVLNECSGTLSFLSLGMLKDARKVVKEFKDGNNDDDTVFFHVLSNRGMFVYLEVARLLPSTIKVGGVVFDSCKCFPSPCLSPFFELCFVETETDNKISKALAHCRHGYFSRQLLQTKRTKH